MAIIADDHARVREISAGFLGGMVVIGSTTERFLQDGGNPAHLLRASYKFLKSSGSTLSALVDIGGSGPEDRSEKLYVKEFRFKGAIYYLKHLFRPHRAQSNGWFPTIFLITEYRFQSLKDTCSNE